MLFAIIQACALTLGGCGGGGGDGTGASETGQDASTGTTSGATRGSTGTTGTGTTGTSTGTTTGSTTSTGSTTGSTGSTTGGTSGSTSGSTGGGATSSTLGVGFSFTLSASRTTSAGVFNTNGQLVRTLWRGQALSAGTYQRTWDQKDDGGNLLPTGNYTIKVLHHNVQYVWEGVVGNTSATAGAAVLHHSYHVPSSLAAIPGGMVYSVGYNEWQSALNGFTLQNPQLNTSPVRLVDPFVSADMLASDGQRVYWADTGGAMSTATFIGAMDMTTGQQAAFSSAGTAHCLYVQANSTNCFSSENYTSVLDYRADNSQPATGLAVQVSGHVLAVAYGVDNLVKFFDKTTGTQLGSLSVPLVASTRNQIAFSPAGDLWVLGANGATRYTGLPANPTAAAQVTGLSKPLAVTVDPANEDAVWIADGGSSEQVKRFNHLGAALGTIGVAGGYTGSQITVDRFNFAFTYGHEFTALAVDDNHNLWIGDTGNNRLLEMSPLGQYLNQIAYQPTDYSMSADAGNPTRVFLGFLEFNVDYSRPLTDPNSWKLVRNWMNTLPSQLRDPSDSNASFITANWGFTGLRTVVTLGNGRTYAVTSLQQQDALIELGADGNGRFIQWLHVPASGETRPAFYENGDVGWSTSDGTTQSAVRQPFTGFDSAGNPQWGPLTVMASVPALASTPYYQPGSWAGLVGPRFPITGSGQVVWLDDSVLASTGFHLGAVAQGGTSFAWQASPSGPMDGLGTYQTQATDPTIQYGGDMVHALGHDIVYGFHGEGFTDPLNGKVGQANQWMHFHDDGLFVGEFGVPSTRATSAAQPGLSGNAFSSSLVQVNGQVYLYHNDESTFSGVQRWRLAGLSDVQEMVATAATGATAITLH